MSKWKSEPEVSVVYSSGERKQISRIKVTETSNFGGLFINVILLTREEAVELGLSLNNALNELDIIEQEAVNGKKVRS